MRRLNTGLSTLVGLAVLLASFSGCKLGPDFETPVVEDHPNFVELAPDGESIANLPWWELFDDETLQDLIRAALDDNQDVGIALERIAEARATLGFVRADEYPSFGYSAGAARSDPGDKTSFGRTGPANDFALGADMVYEVDLWGKLRRATEAARAELLATEATYTSVIITLVADVASTYLLLLDLDEQLVITQRTFETRQTATRIIRERFEEGVVAKLDVHQAEIEETTAEVGISRLERQIIQAEHALRVLLGRTPGRIPRGTALGKQLPREVPVGLPSELLERRPDIEVARNIAAAETARIGVAEALRFPQISVTGALGLQSEDIDDLFSSSAQFWSLGSALSGPLFEFGKNVRRVEAQEARARQAVLDYERTVLQSFREVEDALVAVRTFRVEFEVRTRQVAAAQEAARLARALYDEQFTSYLDVLDSERSLFDAELARSAALRSSLQGIVQLYKALGGGWETGESQEAEPAPEDAAPKRD